MALNRFNIDDIKKNSVIKIGGSRFSGKTILAKNIIYRINNNKTKTVIVFTPFMQEYINITFEKLIFQRMIDYNDIKIDISEND